MHFIENEFLKVKFREYGAELTSVFDKKNGIEHLWQADEKFWGWHAPVLFPVIGRCLNDEILINGKAYPMEKHGFARKSNFKLLELSDHKAVFSLASSPETLAIYPFQFEFLIGYRLAGNTLVCSYEVINHSSGPMPFQLGGHPAFAAPFADGGSYTNYYIEFERPETTSRHFINSEGYFNGQTAPVLSASHILALRPDLFNDDALIFKDLESRKVTLKATDNPHYVQVSFTGFSYLGLWAKPNAPYVCIEPWIGCADTSNKKVQLSEKEDIIIIQPNEEFNRKIEITVG